MSQPGIGTSLLVTLPIARDQGGTESGPSPQPVRMHESAVPERDAYR